jgi:hypothetical protein
MQTITQSPPITDRSRVHRTGSFEVGGPPEEVFPLLCPVREFDWIKAWDCDLIYTASGVAEEGCVFQTANPADGGTDTWVVSRFEPEGRISFIRVNPLRTIRYDVFVERTPAGGSALRWEQEITSLTEAADAHVRSLDQEAFTRQISTLEAMLEHYLRTGEALDAED